MSFRWQPDFASIGLAKLSADRNLQLAAREAHCCPTLLPRRRRVACCVEAL